MKNRYTKKQIEESIKYWKKQLKLGNYKKLNEANASLDDFEQLTDTFNNMCEPFLDTLSANYDALYDVSDGTFNDLFEDLKDTKDDISSALMFNKGKIPDLDKILDLIEYLQNDIYIPIQTLVSDINSNECKKACMVFGEDLENFMQDVIELHTEFQV